ncbi:MAG: ABC transporter ATP-binding protein [Oscillospiraceae bacterium]|nr:ABC transporter ATP-binding protein [Oscillospiraceae bacterium]
MAKVIFENIYKVYDKEVVAVKDFNLEIADKEFVVLVGPSGCGKSTTLRMVAGLEEITQGRLYIGDTLVNDVPPKDRDISMVFQNYALYPHMSVYDNIAFPLKMRKLPKKIIDEKVRQAAEILDITELLKRKPKALSGGQRQRVAIGRAIVREPQVFLMDEPLSNLDAKLRNQMRTELIKLRRRINTTFIYVTHDQTEAMTLGDRIVIMDKGVVQQVGSPRQVFDEPENLFVAGFIGTPQMNFIDAELTVEGENIHLYAGGQEIEISPNRREMLLKNGVSGGRVILGVRPEDIFPAERGLAARADVSEMLGSTYNLHAFVGETEIVSQTDGVKIAPGQDLFLMPHGDRIHLFDPDTGESLLFKRHHCSASPSAEEREMARAEELISILEQEQANGE